MNLARVFFGAAIVAVGALLLLDNLGALDAGQVISDWWPVALIGGGVISLLSNRRHWLVPVLLIGGGGLILLRTTGVIDSLNVLLPVAIIVVGLFFLFGRGMGGPTEAGDAVNSFNLFSGSELASNSSEFSGGRIGALFGGAELDLRNARPAPGARLDVFAAFAGVEISVPRGWNVDISGFPIFGGYENATAKDELSTDAPRLQIDATVLFGGLEVKH